MLEAKKSQSNKNKWLCQNQKQNKNRSKTKNKNQSNLYKTKTKHVYFACTLLKWFRIITKMKLRSSHNHIQCKITQLCSRKFNI